MSGVKNAVVVGKIELKPKTPPKYTGPRPIKTYGPGAMVVAEKPIKKLGPKPPPSQKSNKVSARPATQSQQMAELQFIKKQVRDLQEELALAKKEYQAARRQLQSLGVGLP